MTSRLRILFIGNSHTYFNDMPNMAASFLREKGFQCEVTMIAHGGWYLEQHTKEPDVRFNILFGHYDYVVMQEFSHPFGPEEKYYSAVRTLNGWIREAGSTPVIYMTWAQKKEPDIQKRMSAASRTIAEETGALVAPVGEKWWAYREAHPGIEMYFEDGAHASAEGSRFAASVIADTIEENENDTDKHEQEVE